MSKELWTLYLDCFAFLSSIKSIQPSAMGRVMCITKEKHIKKKKTGVYKENFGANRAINIRKKVSSERNNFKSHIRL
jgi:hypothetical protein